MQGAKTDTRPEGSVLLCAKMFGAWNEAVYLATAAQAAGYAVNMAVIQTRAFPFHLQTIECAK